MNFDRYDIYCDMSLLIKFCLQKCIFSVSPFIGIGHVKMYTENDHTTALANHPFHIPQIDGIYMATYGLYVAYNKPKCR